MGDSTKEALSKQKRTYIAIVAAVVLVVLGIYYFVLEDNIPEKPEKKQKVHLPGNSIDTQKILLSRVEKQNQNMESKINFIEEVVLDGKKKEEKQQQENAELRLQVQNLKNQIKEFFEKEKKEPKQKIYFDSVEPEEVFLRAPLNELVAEEKEYKLKNVENVIPAGTTVKAILVSSVDANCSTFSLSDPQPIKLRILDDGHLPKGVTVHLKGGIAIASAYGDISSERAYIRLERLTQVNPSGDFVETEVTGFISGEDGKYGVRGIVVDRSEKQVKNAALSGFFSGVSQLAQSAIDAKYRGYCDSDYRHFDTNLLGEAALSGTSSAFDRLSEYYIKRSEQIRPVIQVDAGRVVDITFTYSAEIGDLHTKRKVEALRERTRGGYSCAP